jgi:hypothetical protein
VIEKQLISGERKREKETKGEGIINRKRQRDREAEPRYVQPQLLLLSLAMVVCFLRRVYTYTRLKEQSAIGETH